MIANIPYAAEQGRVAGRVLYRERPDGRFDDLYVDSDYRYLVYGHPSRDYAWIMARDTEIVDQHYPQLLAELAAQGFDTTNVLKVPQRRDQLGAPGFQ